MPGASYSHRQGAQEHLPGEVAYIEAAAAHDVCLPKGVRIAIAPRVETLVDIPVNVEAHRVETDVAVAFGSRVDGAVHLEPPVHIAYLEPHVSGPLEAKTFEALDGHLVLDFQRRAAGEQRADVDVVPRNQTSPF